MSEEKTIHYYPFTQVRLKRQTRHTLDVLNQDFAGAGAGVGFANVVDSDDPEAVALQLTEAGNGKLCGGVQAVDVVDPHPV